MSNNAYEMLNVAEPVDGVQQIQLDRPEALNALTTALLGELSRALDVAEANSHVKVVVLTGSIRAFAAGADVKEMAERDLVGIVNDPRQQSWQRITQFSKPIVAAINGYCLGGGCELAMHADILIAGTDAKFGQPEINLGIIPGAGGTQRLVRAVGKSLGMQMVLTGQPINAEQAKSAGLISEITQPELTLPRAMEVASQIAQKSALAVRLAKECVLKGMDTDLATGLRFERHAFTVLSGTKDRDEGIAAFLEKRKPTFTGQ
ncbi:2,3-dehydroadipyl-CoA hydratase PaaF [Marinomonas arenicola]|uniref:2,3-dehydroadipyl-CoA hydratase PaaF n=1 Tax=Marinomonas arenicola TaxID=569601 RepID=A0ABU9GBS7_9GAMM